MFGIEFPRSSAGYGDANFACSSKSPFGAVPRLVESAVPTQPAARPVE